MRACVRVPEASIQKPLVLQGGAAAALLQGGELKLDSRRHAVGLVTRLMFFLRRHVEAQRGAGVDTNREYPPLAYS